MVQSVGRLAQLERWQRLMLVRAFLYLSVIDLALRLVPLRRLADVGAKATESVPLDDVRRAYLYASWIAYAARHHYADPKCLPRSLALYSWLRRDGMPCALRIGVRKEDGALKAHAWVEVSGYVVDDNPTVTTSAFVPLA